MRLVTLGGLRLAGSDFARTKPLLLLAFLSLEGPQERRFLAELFWPGARDPRNSLSAALARLRRLEPVPVEADERRAWTSVACDAAELAGLATSDPDAALALVAGPFLDGVALRGLGAELEEWVVARREDAAARVRCARLARAEGWAARGDFRAASDEAERALAVPHAPPAEPEELARLHALFVAHGSHLAARVREDAAALGLELELSPDAARARLRRTLLGREAELERLRALGPGAWGWIEGGPGLGKSVLLRALGGRLVRGRPGLPFASLEPLVGARTAAGRAAVVRALQAPADPLLIDGWERLDPDSREALERLREVGAEGSVVVASRDPPPFPCEVVVRLGPLRREELAGHPGLWEATRGVPALVGAQLDGREAGVALDETLAALPAPAGDVLLALALPETPDPAAARRALGLTGAALGAALETLLDRGLITPEGAVRPREAMRELLERHPGRAAPVALRLARALPPREAFPLYRRVRPLWESEDAARAAAAYRAWAEGLLERGFPERALAVLEELPEAEGLEPLRARALELSGRHGDALAVLEGGRAGPDRAARRGALLWRVGRPEDARREAGAALGGEPGHRAEALTTLGRLEGDEGRWEEAARHFGAAAAQWRAAGDPWRLGDALGLAADAAARAGVPAEEVEARFGEALAATEGHPALRWRVRHDLARARRARGDAPGAVTALRALLGEGGADADPAARAVALSDLASLLARGGARAEAAEAYRRAVEHARAAGEPRLEGQALAELAELEGDEPAWREALRLLAESGVGPPTRDEGPA